MKKLMRAASVCLALCMLLTVFAGAASDVRFESYSLDGGRLTMSLPAGWSVETDCADGSLLKAVSGNVTLTVIKQKVYHLIDPVEPPVTTASTGTSTASVSGSLTTDLTEGNSGLALSGSLTVHGVEFSTYFTEDANGAVRSYWTSYADMEYRLTFTCAGGPFSDKDLELVEQIVNSTEVRWSSFEVDPEPSTQPDTAFLDLEGHWAKSYAVRAVELGLFNGLSNTRFGPDEPMSRAMLVTVLHRMAGKPAAGNAAFTDVAAGSYYAGAMAWAAANGIVQGSDGKFRPNDPVTRQELAAILYRYDGLQAASAANALKGFSDAASVAAWAREAMAWAVTKGLITGSAGKLLPTGVSTRAQVAAILVRYLDAE